MSYALFTAANDRDQRMFHLAVVKSTGRQPASASFPQVSFGQRIWLLRCSKTILVLKSLLRARSGDTHLQSQYLKLRQEDSKFKTSLDYVARPFLNIYILK